MTEPPATINFRVVRDPDFKSYYANNVTVESSVWDLKVIFGQLDQAANTITQDSSLTLSWIVAKLLVFYLQTQIKAHETQNGKVLLPFSVLPAEFVPPPEEHKDNPVFAKTYEEITKLRTEFIKENQS